ncbi:hypothetical protein GUJ93_ZPchr0009g2306 [Zizania palustris]|uniref:Mei2-like C-terminal RNA recognition motif domain-containing protein n=1 Tax=Zizania palustris TaxID=103762 RepID=A0A8J5UYW1_ZIZPA|nr:hypothetical protein GUJ93_ZPchr0009g2306 [Zizania palustris]
MRRTPAVCTSHRLFSQTEVGASSLCASSMDMDSCHLSGLNSSAAPFEPVTRVRAEYPCPPPLPTPATFFPPQCLYPRPPPPPPPPVFAGLVASSCLSGGGFGTKQGCTSRPFVQPHACWVRPALPPPPPPPSPPLMVYWSYQQALPPAASSTTPRRPAHPPPPFAATTVMIRNIPNKFTKRRLMAILDQHCAEENGKIGSRRSRRGCTVAKSEYDFLYVPVDFRCVSRRTYCNKGYAFVNMTTVIAAQRLSNFLKNHRWGGAASSGKVCDVVPATIQGREPLVRHFSASRFPCPTKSHLPVWFEPPRDGARKTAAHVVGTLFNRRR